MCAASCRQDVKGHGSDDNGDRHHRADESDPFAQPNSETGGASAAAEPTTAVFSALSPVQIVARGDVKIGYFDVSRFIKSVGPFAKVG